MKKYSRIIKYGKREFRYNYTDNMIEHVSNKDFDFDKNDEIIEITLPEYEVISAQGLMLENWQESNIGMCELFSQELDEENYYLMQQLKQEFGF